MLDLGNCFVGQFNKLHHSILGRQVGSFCCLHVMIIDTNKPRTKFESPVKLRFAHSSRKECRLCCLEALGQHSPVSHQEVYSDKK